MGRHWLSQELFWGRYLRESVYVLLEVVWRAELLRKLSLVRHLVREMRLVLVLMLLPFGLSLLHRLLQLRLWLRLAIPTPVGLLRLLVKRLLKRRLLLFLLLVPLLLLLLLLLLRHLHSWLWLLLLLLLRLLLWRLLLLKWLLLPRRLHLLLLTLGLTA